MKRCGSCKKLLRITRFCKYKRAKDGRNYQCKRCSKIEIEKWRKKNKKWTKKYSRRYLKTHREQIRKNKRLYRRRHPQRARAQVRRAYNKNKKKYMRRTYYQLMLERYGLTKKQIKSLLEQQGNVCAICKKRQKCGKRTRLYLDHCHTTNKFRGFLCFSCNSMLGFAKDSIDIMEKGILYMRQFNSVAA